MLTISLIVVAILSLGLAWRHIARSRASGGVFEVDETRLASRGLGILLVYVIAIVAVVILIHRLHGAGVL